MWRDRGKHAEEQEEMCGGTGGDVWRRHVEGQEETCGGTEGDVWRDRRHVEG